MFNEKVGAYIMILRKAKKHTQQELADKLGVSHQAVSNWERGESMPDISMLPKLAALLGTTTDNILSADQDDFGGFDEILEKVRIVKKRKKNKDAEILEYLNDIAAKLNEIIVNYNKD
ncbi:MAG: helix-turn-helix domain-containing protein [Oscillospiraceae bacterium]|nr:helix-turn-helix domain-containing protein [Oscillospiraceae bacterium]MCL2159795.1 helix-turn-helix domain-containing protein [Oscillospiraceae bacterium]